MNTKGFSIFLKIIALALTICSIILIALIAFWSLVNNPQYDPEFWYEDLFQILGLFWTIVVLFYYASQLIKKLMSSGNENS